MKTFLFKTKHQTLLADVVTPVSIYLRLRDIFPNSIMLESSDYHGNENSMSYICCQPIAGISLENNILNKYYPDGTQSREEKFHLINEISAFKDSFKTENSFKYISNGLFGYFSYEAVQHFENIKFGQSAHPKRSIPEMQYHIYRYIIAINHHKNELYLFENYIEGQESESRFEEIKYLLQNREYAKFDFQLVGKEESNFTDEGFLALVKKLQTHVQRGDVFQIVGSRSFSRAFMGDEFNVYRTLRSINPSPYLFYFDYGNFRLFGSSPEAQIVIKNQEASIFPIAGTIRRTGNDVEDARRAEQLAQDPKENAEHTMLVDLARNDLSRHCDNVHVASLKETQYYSHVIHLVSKVSGKIKQGVPVFNIVGDTFPAGTLSGAPKYRAMQLLDENEKGQRGFYSGAIGYMGFDDVFNHAIIIRSFMSKQNTLYYQAGAGIVLDSIPENELKEVNNKIAALRNAMEQAEKI